MDRFIYAINGRESRKVLMPKRSINSLFCYIERILDDYDSLTKRFLHLLGLFILLPYSFYNPPTIFLYLLPSLEPKEAGLFSTSATTVSGRRGHLLLTQTHILFISVCSPSSLFPFPSFPSAPIPSPLSLSFPLFLRPYPLLSIPFRISLQQHEFLSSESLSPSTSGGSSLFLPSHPIPPSFPSLLLLHLLLAALIS